MTCSGTGWRTKNQIFVETRKRNERSERVRAVLGHQHRAQRVRSHACESRRLPRTVRFGSPRRRSCDGANAIFLARARGRECKSRVSFSRRASGSDDRHEGRPVRSAQVGAKRSRAGSSPMTCSGTGWRTQKQIFVETRKRNERSERVRAVRRHQHLAHRIRSHACESRRLPRTGRIGSPRRLRSCDGANAIARARARGRERQSRVSFLR
ncbi:hypothetical protein BH11MYX2_BH11MYX2_23540 [soil metagenome]